MDYASDVPLMVEASLAKSSITKTEKRPAGSLRLIGSNIYAPVATMDFTQKKAITCDLSPFFHPVGRRARSSFEPAWLGGATGWGAEPRSSSSDPSRCIPDALSFA